MSTNFLSSDISKYPAPPVMGTHCITLIFPEARLVLPDETGLKLDALFVRSKAGVLVMELKLKPCGNLGNHTRTHTRTYIWAGLPELVSLG